MSVINDDDPEMVEYAYITWLSRYTHDSVPYGFMSDHGWYPLDWEVRECCTTVPKPTSASRYTFMRHCRTIAHIAELYGITQSSLRSRIARNRPTARHNEGDNYYKAVALVDGRFLSIYDGRTEYNLGQQVEDRARWLHGGGIYVYLTLEGAQAFKAAVKSVLSDAPRAILRVRAEGKSCIYDNGSLAFSRVTPLEVVA